jgi:urease accessory protein
MIMGPDASQQFLYVLQVANASFPTGAFNHSYGFETWIDGGEVGNAAQLEVAANDWLEHTATKGDAAIVAQAHRAAQAGDAPRLVTLDHVAAAIKLSREAREASDKTGHALLRALRDVFNLAGIKGYLRAIGDGDCDTHYAVVFGAAAAEFCIAEDVTILTYLYSSLSGLIGVAARLIPLGQVESQRIIRNAWPLLLEATIRARDTEPDLIGTATVGLDIASMRHERLYTRLCMS